MADPKDLQFGDEFFYPFLKEYNDRRARQEALDYLKPQAERGPFARQLPSSDRGRYYLENGIFPEVAPAAPLTYAQYLEKRAAIEAELKNKAEQHQQTVDYLKRSLVSATDESIVEKARLAGLQGNPSKILGPDANLALELLQSELVQRIIDGRISLRGDQVLNQMGPSNGKSDPADPTAAPGKIDRDAAITAAGNVAAAASFVDPAPVVTVPGNYPGANPKLVVNEDGTVTTVVPGRLTGPDSGGTGRPNFGIPGLPGAFPDETFRKNPADP